MRLYAIESLQRASADELKMFLLQLVQALKYENAHKIQQHSATKLLEDSVRDDLPTMPSQGIYKVSEFSNWLFENFYFLAVFSNNMAI